ncbi:hypothetical protein ACHWQZ_G002274 [Mnemiopsis leidyi]
MSMVQGLCLLICLIHSARSLAVRDRYFNTHNSVVYYGYWGNWGSWEYCDEGYATSFSQKVEGNQGGGDDTALNGICLHCNNDKTICSTVGPWGSWVRSEQCDAGFTGADFKVESNQGGGDDTAANGLELVCASGGSLFTSNMGSWGSWEGYKYCSSGQRICGIQTRVEPGQGGDDDEDDTTLNGVDLRCCGKISSVNVGLVSIFSRPGDDNPGPEGEKYLKQITSSTGLISNSGYYSSSTIFDIARLVQSMSTAGYSGAVGYVTSHSSLAELVKIAMMSPLNKRYSSSSTTFSVPVNVYVDVYAYVGETMVTMSDGSWFKFRGSEMVKSSEPLSTSSWTIPF